MTATAPIAAGHVCYDSACSLLLGYGATPAEAEADARDCLRRARVRFVLATAPDDGKSDPLATYETDLRTLPCSAGLMGALGDASWDEVDGVACTDDEARRAGHPELYEDEAA